MPGHSQLAFGAVIGGLLLTSTIVAQARGPAGGAEFAPPVRLKAGEAFAGQGRLYPSPVLHDVDGDGKKDLVIGDLPGRVTWARRLPDEDGKIRFASEKPLKDRSGEQLKFHNW